MFRAPRRLTPIELNREVERRATSGNAVTWPGSRRRVIDCSGDRAALDAFAPHSVGKRGRIERMIAPLA